MLSPKGLTQLVAGLFYPPRIKTRRSYGRNIPNMNSDLFIWRESYTTPLNLSVPDLTLGNVATSQLFIDSNSNAYVLWAENTMNGSSSEELYLWNEATGTRQALSQDAFGGTISNLQAVLENDTLFAIWSEYAGSVEPGGPFFGIQFQICAKTYLV